MATVIEQPAVRANPPRRKFEPERQTPTLGKVKNEARQQEEWRNIFNKISAWSETPSEVDEEGWTSPSSEAVFAATQLVKGLGDLWGSMRFSVAQSGEGGITFEHRDGPQTILLQIHSDGKVVAIHLKESRVEDMFQIEL